MEPLRDWQIELPLMLDRRDPEDLHLDYKEKRGLMPPGQTSTSIDKEKRALDVSKDVSSFLNSDGGTLIYGIREDSSPGVTGGAPMPLALFDPNMDGYGDEFTKETLENLITSNINPRPVADLFRITEVLHQDRKIFIVDVAKSMQREFQAKDKRYYKRFNYKEEAMDHYEIEMLRNRAVGPNLALVVAFDPLWAQEILSPEFSRRHEDAVVLYFGVRNIGRRTADTALIEIGLASENFPDGLLWNFVHAQDRNIKIENSEGEIGETEVRWFHCRWNPHYLGSHYQPLFNLLDPVYVSRQKLVTAPTSTNSICYLCWRIQAPDMTPAKGIVEVLHDGNSTLKINHVDWDPTIENLGGSSE